MKTVAEHNEEMRKLDRWVGMDIICPCGCGGELMEERWMTIHKDYKKRVMCGKTGKLGTLQYSGNLIIKDVTWIKKGETKIDDKQK